MARRSRSYSSRLDYLPATRGCGSHNFAYGTAVLRFGRSRQSASETERREADSRVSAFSRLYPPPKHSSREFTFFITSDAIRACRKDPARLDGYKRYVNDDIFKNGLPQKGTIFWIRAGIGSVPEKDDNRKTRGAKVLGQIIQS